jgi:predicted ATPase/Tfp pilus assembly protein PilF
VLDNFEHLLGPEGDEACDLVLEILQEAPGVKLLITSRERLNCEVEFLLDLDGLPYPTQDLSGWPTKRRLANVSCLTYPALQLFLERAGRVQAGFAATDETVPGMARICRLVEGLPLGIELAAASLGMRSLEEVAGALQESLDALAAPLRDLPRRHRSMRAALEHSWRLLSKTEQETYRRLSVFRGGFDPEAARAVVGHGSHQGLPLRELVDKSLLHRQATAPGYDVLRYDLHPLLRQYAAEKLAERLGEKAATQGRHSRYYLNFLREREMAISGEDGKEALDQIQSEMGNVRVAWYWAVDEGQVEALGFALPPLCRFYSLQGPLRDAERVFGEAAERVAALDDQMAHRVACRLLTEQADFVRRRGDYEQAIEVAQSAIALAQANGQAACEAKAAVVWGESLWRQSRYGQARRQLEDALILARSLPDGEPLQTRCLNGLAAVSWRHGDFGAARVYLEESLRLAAEAGEARRQSVALGNLGVVAVEQGEYEAAEQYYRRALEIERGISEREGEGVSLLSLGNLSLYLGAYAEAERRYRQALAIHQEVGARQNEAWTLGNLGLLAHYCGDEALALHNARQALKMAEEIGHQTMQAAMWMKVGHALAGLERLEEATMAYGESVALRRALDEGNMATEPLAGLARVCLARGDPGQAQSYVEDILSHLGSGGTLDGTISPFQVYLTSYHVLDANQDLRAWEILAEGYQLLQGRAAKITDEKLRHSFLENVAAHRELVQAFERMREAQLA